MSASFSHPLLGQLVPKSGDGISQFLGVKYASLKDRFAPPKLFCPKPGHTDLTSHGPSVITPPIGCELEFGFIQKSLPAPKFSLSEVEGLNLNITVPNHVLKDQKFPVFVFLHGGGFGIGGNSWPQYDLGKIVQLSVEVGQPIIGININYRLGIFGFLTSDELRNAGYFANNGLQDQRVAFEWIKKFIGGFGGDPENITVGGESAGGVSTTHHLYSKEPQFTRAISMGGTSLLMKPLPLFACEMIYQMVLGHLGIVVKTPEERVHALLTMPVTEILSKLPPGLPLFPAIDGDIISVPTTYQDVVDLGTSNIPGKHWCKSLLIGDNQLDATIFVQAIESRQEDIASNFVTSITKSLASHPGISDALLKSYGITDIMKSSDATSSILEFMTDMGFFAPTLTYAKGWPGKAFVYCFNELNPWEGRFKGYSSHILDVAFLFQNYNDELNAAQAQSAKNFASDVIKFVNGLDPWSPFEKDFVVRVYGPSEASGAAVLLECAGPKDPKIHRRGNVFQFAESPGLDVISNAFTTYLSGQ